MSPVLCCKLIIFQISSVAVMIYVNIEPIVFCLTSPYISSDIVQHLVALLYNILVMAYTLQILKYREVEPKLLLVGITKNT
jgi:hypothetical protein